MDYGARLWNDWRPFFNLSRQVLVVKDPYDQARFDWFCRIFQHMRGILVIRHPLRVSTNRPGSANMRFQAWMLTMLEAMNGEHRCPVMLVRLEDLVRELNGPHHKNAWQQIASFVNGDLNDPQNYTLVYPYKSDQNHCQSQLNRKREFHGNKNSNEEKIRILCSDTPQKLDIWFNKTKPARLLASVHARHRAALLRKFGYALEPPLVRTRPHGYGQTFQWFE